MDLTRNRKKSERDWRKLDCKRRRIFAHYIAKKRKENDTRSGDHCVHKVLLHSENQSCRGDIFTVEGGAGEKFVFIRTKNKYSGLFCRASLAPSLFLPPTLTTWSPLATSQSHSQFGCQCQKRATNEMKWRQRRTKKKEMIFSSSYEVTRKYTPTRKTSLVTKINKRGPPGR